MKKFFCFLLGFLLVFGGLTFGSFAEETGETPPSIAESSETPPSIAESSEAPPSGEESGGAPPSGEESGEAPSSGEESSGAPSSGEESSGAPSSGEESSKEVPCEVTVVETEGGSIEYAEKAYHVGEKFEARVVPEPNKGVRAVFVNGEKYEDMPVDGGDISLELQGSTEIRAEFADTVRVVVDCGEGGSFSVDGYKNLKSGTGFHVISGSDFVLHIYPAEGRRITSVSDGAEKVTRQIKGGVYRIEKIDKGHVIDIKFREEDERDGNSFTVTVNTEGNGSVVPSGKSDVKQGEDLVLDIMPDPGYEVREVVENGETNAITGSTYTVRNVTKDLTVTVRFTKTETAEDSSEASKPPAPPEPEGCITRADIERMIGGQADSEVIRISLSSKSKMDSSALKYINELIESGRKVEAGVPGLYWWLFPGDAYFSTAAVGRKGIDLGINVNEGGMTAEIMSEIEGKAEKRGYNHVYKVAIERKSDAALPEGTKLKVHMGDSFEPGWRLDWLKYDPASKSFSQMCGNEGVLTTVDNGRYATVEMPPPQKYGLLINYIRQNSVVTVSWKQAECSLSLLGKVSLCEGDFSTDAIMWKNGEDFCIDVTLKSGFTIQEIVSPDFDNMVLSSNGADVTGSAAKGVTDSVTIRVPGVSRNGSIKVVTTDNPEPSPVENDGKTPWARIILIAVIVVAMAAGGVVFIVKWQQSDDDDDDDDDFDGEDGDGGDSDESLPGEP